MKTYLLTLVGIFCFQFSYCQVKDTMKVKNDSLKIAQSQTPATPSGSSKGDKRPLKERIGFGFGGSLWFTANQTYIEVAPAVAYFFPKALTAGVGYRYIYRHDRVINKNMNAYGPDFFARLNLIPKIYLWTEYEILYNQYYTQPFGQELSKNTSTVDSWFAGLGYMKSMGRKGRGGISIQVLYNFLYKDDDINPYYSPVTYRVGYYF